MIENYKVITLCGSTKFKDEFMRVQKELTLAGNIVISVGLFGHSGDKEVWTEGTKEMLDDMHKRKIDMADEIFVVNVDGYIGESTKSEIKYAKEHGKKVNYLVHQLIDKQIKYKKDNTIHKVKDCTNFNDDQEFCVWIKYDYRTMCPKYHDINNPYWRTPENMEKLKYCPYCGKKIKMVD